MDFTAIQTVPACIYVSDVMAKAAVGFLRGKYLARGKKLLLVPHLSCQLLRLERWRIVSDPFLILNF